MTNKLMTTRIRLEMKRASLILKERGLDDNGQVQKYIDSRVLTLMAPYTPKDKGALIASATRLTKIGSGKVYQGGGDSAPYARKWYHKSANFTGGPMRGTKWFERAMQDGGRKSILEGIIRMTGAKK